MKLRIRATKLGKVRFTSHRDAARMWERALRRAGLPVAFTEGFTPRPKLSFGLALPTGAESIAEYVDIELQPDTSAADIDLNTLPARLSAALPAGFDVLVAGEREPGVDSLQEAVASCTWELWSPLLGAADHVEACRLLESTELVLERERKGKRSADDVRPMILDMRPADDHHDDHHHDDHHHDDHHHDDRLIVDLVTIGRALRPGELAQLAYPRIDARDVRALRTHQWLAHDGGRREVLPLPVDVDARTLAVPA